MNWELYDGKEQRGPLSEAEVVAAIHAGEVPPAAQVRPEGKGTWKSLRAHAPFAMALDSTASPPAAPAPMPPQYPVVAPPQQYPSGEHVYLNEPGVTITSARAMLNGTTYALTNITSVRAFTEGRPTNVLTAMLLFGVGGLAMIPLQGTCAGTCLVIAAVLTLIYFAAFNVKHWVCIGTAGAESNAVCYKDPNDTARVVAALNAAIVSRG